MSHGFIRRGLLAAGAVLLTAAVAATPATADPKSASKPITPSLAQPTEGVPAGFGSWTEVYAFQDRLNAAASEIVATDGTDNASIVASPLNRELRVYWSGKVPSAVQTVANRQSVPVKLLPAAYPHRDLVAEAQRLATDPRVAVAAPKPDGSGLDITVDSAVSGINQADLASATRMPMSVKTGDRPQSVIGRQADTPPFWGGARYNTAVGGCSTGFSLAVPGAPNVFMLSAGHCGNNGGAANIPGQPVPTGTILNKVACRDILAINFPAGVAGRIYTGAFNSVTSIGVAGAGQDFVGNLIRTGGASSGEHANIPVTAVNLFVAIGGIPCAAVGPLTLAQNPPLICAVAPGDSGGPAYVPAGTRITARGTISAGSGPAICPGVVPNGFSNVFYAPLSATLPFYGVGVLPG